MPSRAFWGWLKTKYRVGNTDSYWNSAMQDNQSRESVFANPDLLPFFHENTPQIQSGLISLKSKLRILHPTYRKIINLTFSRNLTQRQISAIMGISQATVCRWLSFSMSVISSMVIDEIETK